MTVCIRWPKVTNANVLIPEEGSIRTEGKGVYDLRAETIY